MISSTNENKKLTTEKEVEVRDAWMAVKSRLEVVGNLVHDSVPVSDNEVHHFTYHVVSLLLLMIVL